MKGNKIILQAKGKEKVMCNVFSGHIVIDKDSKRFGEVIYKTGVHHEKDRETIPKYLKVAAWETVKPMSFDGGFNLTHMQGDISEKEKDEYLGLLKEWGNKQNIKELSKSFLTVLKDGKPYENYTIGDMDVSCLENNVSIITDIEEITQKAGDSSTQTAGYSSTQKAGDYSTQTAGYSSTQTAGSSSTQTAGDSSTQTARYSSTQKAGYSSTQIIYGDASYIILYGEHVVLRQIFNGQSYILNHDDLFAKGFNKGDKFKVVKGVAEKV